MKTLSIIILLTTLFISVAIPLQGELARESDNEEIQGIWEVIHLQEYGKEDSSAKGLIVIFDKGKVIAKINAEVIGEGTYRLDPNKTPKWIDTTLNGRTVLGIYELEGDSLRVCHVDDVTQKRSTRFVSEFSAENQVLFVLKRVRK
jgi:uncharacterized protein (TIGR03067 family)